MSHRVLHVVLGAAFLLAMSVCMGALGIARAKKPPVETRQRCVVDCQTVFFWFVLFCAMEVTSAVRRIENDLVWQTLAGLTVVLVSLPFLLLFERERRRARAADMAEDARPPQQA